MTKHAVLGASSSARWKGCPGSVREITALPELLQNPTSSYAQEGSAAHALGEKALKGQTLDGFFGKWISPEGKVRPTRADGFFRVDETMRDAVREYINEVTYHMRRLQGAQLKVEVTVQPLLERDDMFGTADAIIIEPFGELVVIDFKYGAGYAVEADWNDQAMFYALGALNTIGDDAAVSKITIVIVQPRAKHDDGTIRRWTVPVEVVRSEADMLRSAADATRRPDAPLVPGDAQCRFCPAAGRCPAMRQLVIKSAVKDFESLVPTQPLLPNPDDPEQIARALKLADLIETWPKAVRAIALNAANLGKRIPGFKLVRGTKHRKWRDESEVISALTTRRVSPEDFCSDPELKSPAQMEKLMGKEWVANYAIKPEGQPQLVPDSDQRPAIAPGVVSDFAALTESNER